MKQSKTCNKCGQIKSINDFYYRDKKLQTYLAVCKVCKDEYAKAYQRANAKSKQISLPMIDCLRCKVTFQPRRKWQKYCSRTCGYTQNNQGKYVNSINYKFCARCNKSLQDKRSNAIYCSRTCNSMDHNFKYLGAKGIIVRTARRREIIERDGFLCYLCNKQLEFKAIEIDHLIPKSRGGTSDPSNLAVACLPCNRSKGNRIGIEQLVMLKKLREFYDY